MIARRFFLERKRTNLKSYSARHIVSRESYGADRRDGWRFNLWRLRICLPNTTHLIILPDARAFPAPFYAADTAGCGPLSLYWIPSLPFKSGPVRTFSFKRVAKWTSRLSRGIAAWQRPLTCL